MKIWFYICLCMGITETAVSLVSWSPWSLTSQCFAFTAAKQVPITSETAVMSSSGTGTGMMPMIVSTPSPVFSGELTLGDQNLHQIASPSTYDRLRKNVDFWIRIYTQYNSDQGLIHDAKYIDHVYQLIQLNGNAKKNRQLIKNAKRKWRELLLAVHRKQNHPEEMTAEERRVFELFRDVQEPNKYLNAAHRKRLRYQSGQKDRFLEGVYQSGLYLSKMEEIFRREGIPVELTRLPFVESSFNLRARSKVGASGIWQFMRHTGKLFLSINKAVDERNDPILATEAAAKLLRLNFGSLKSWPLAVTAYNHGRQGMMRAVQKVGSDELGELLDHYRSRSFGFASSNFFAELLAAVEVEKNIEKYFGKLPDRGKPANYIEIRIPRFMSIQRIAQQYQVKVPLLAELNPALTDSVLKGHLMVPSGYSIRMPQPDGMTLEQATRFYLQKQEGVSVSPPSSQAEVSPGLPRSQIVQ